MANTMDITLPDTIDLIDDIWQRIFLSFRVADRARLLGVCRRWLAILKHSNCWRSLNCAVYNDESFALFLNQYCQSTQEICFYLHLEQPALDGVFEALARINLRRLDIRLKTSFNHRLLLEKPPAWNNLIFFSISTASSYVIPSEAFDLLVEGAPNIEELYLLPNVSCREPEKSAGFFALKKLRKLYVNQEALLKKTLTVKDFIAQAPQLQFLFSNVKLEDLQRFAIINNTTVVHPKFLQEVKKLEDLKKIGQLLPSSNYFHCLSRIFNTSKPVPKELCDYLFRELNLDINQYFLFTERENRRPFSAQLFKEDNEGCLLRFRLKTFAQTKLLLEYGADPNFPYPNASPLCAGNMTKDTYILLLDSGADPMKLVNGKPAFWEVAKRGDPDCCEILRAILKKGIDVNFTTGKQTTILTKAVHKKLKSTVILLAEHGATWTPKVMTALFRWDEQMWKEVISTGAFDVKKLTLLNALEAAPGHFELIADFFKTYPKEFDERGFKLIHYLTLLGTVPSVKSKNSTAAGMRSIRTSILEEIITELKLDVNELTESGESPLLLLCLSDSPEDIQKTKLLIRLGADVNFSNPEGWTPLHAAFNENDKSGIIDLLLSHGANINAQDKLGITPPMMGVLNGFSFKWDNFFKYNIDFALCDKPFKRTLLHFLAVWTDCQDFLTELTTHLKEGKIDVNCRDMAGFTPLHAAARQGNTLLVKTLLEYGADANAMTNTLKLTPAMSLLSYLAANSAGSRFIRNYDTLNECNNCAQHIRIDGVTFTKLIRPPWWSKNQDFSKDNEKTLLIATVDEILTMLFEKSDLTLTDHLGKNVLHYVVYRQKNIFTWVTKCPKLAELWAMPNKKGTTPLHSLISVLTAINATEKDLTTLIAEQSPKIVQAMNSEDEFGMTGLQRLIQSHLLYAHSSLLCTIEGLDWSKVKIKPKETSLIHEVIENNLLDPKIIENIARGHPEKVNKKVYGLTPLAFYLLEKMLKGIQYADKRKSNFSVAHWRIMIDCLLNLPGVDIDTQDNDGNTPLHHACFYFHLGVLDTINGWLQTFNRSVRYCYIAFRLVEAGAKTDIKNNNGQTVFDVLPHLMDYYTEYWPQIKTLINDNHKITETKIKKK